MKFCSVQPRDRLFAKGYGFLTFAKNMGEDFGKNISENVRGKYSETCIDHAKQSATDVLKLLQKQQFKKH